LQKKCNMFESNEKRTELSDLGEFGLIEFLTKNVEIHNSNVIKGIGDDAAVLESKDKQSLITKDLLVEGVHFDLSYMPLKHLGYKAVVVNVSDIVAMNGVAKSIVVGIAASNRFSVEALEEIYSGIKLACKQYKVDLIGGDTVSNPKGLTISVTAIGEIGKGEAVYRSGAQVNDLIFVSGDLGAAYIGLLTLEREKKTFQADPNFQPDLAGYEYVLERHLKPEARNDVIEKLKDLNIRPTSMIDISDGLASECIHICKSSSKGCLIYDDKIPVDSQTMLKAEEFNISAATAALNGGEDYELLFTVSQKDYETLKDIEGLQVIGHITNADEGMNYMTNSGSLVPLTAQGWDAFFNENSDSEKMNEN